MEKTILEKIEKATKNVPKVYNRGYSNGLKAGFAAGGGSSGVDEASINIALDDVIAFQDSLIPKLPTFTFDDFGTLHTLEFEEGMTWGEWCASAYNTVDMYINEEQSNAVYHLVSSVNDATSDYQIYNFHLIIANGTYAKV